LKLTIALCEIKGKMSKLPIILDRGNISVCNFLQNKEILIGVSIMLFNATFNNISVISWRSVLLVEETRVHGENQRPIASH
jgi:hypothetical protein